MRIASYNLENLGRDFGDGVGFSERIKALAPRIERLQADVLCFQEVDGVRAPGTGRSPRGLGALEAVLAETPAAGFALAATHHPQTGRTAEQHNIVVASRYPISAVNQLYHDRVPPPRHAFLTADAAPDEPLAEIRFDRPILHCVLSPPGAPPLHVVNLHLKAPVAAPVPGGKTGPEVWRSAASWAEGFHIAAMKRTAQALEARLLVDDLLDADPDARIVVAGDFNAEENETPLRILRADVETTGSAALAGRVLTLLEAGLPPHRRHTVIHRGRPIMLDHLLASRALAARFRDMEVHNEALADETLVLPGGGMLPESFHAPIVATFAA